MLATLRGLWGRGSHVVDRLWGGHCFVCRDTAVPAGELLCSACELELPMIGDPRCPVCALPAPAGATCGRCLSSPPAFDETVAALDYVFPADVMLHAFKFRGVLALGAYFGRRLARRVSGACCVDRVVPVPLAPVRLASRGFNQSLEIARAIGEVHRIRVLPWACDRVRDTLAQSDLPWAARARNVRGAFAVRTRFDGLAVAVVDDVMTTGATLSELARALRSAGAARVVNWVVARTPPPELRTAESVLS